MKAPKTIEEIKTLISNKVEENHLLEYKAGDALQNTNPKKKEIAKDVSAMANAAGGLIIYGVKEYDNPEQNHLPEKISAVKRTEFTKEQLEQIIFSNISPKLENILIHPISIPDSNEEVIYVVEIGQSTTAHQNTKDHKYYIRRNFQNEPMLDYEVRDIMNRTKQPDLELSFEIEKKIYEVEKTIPGSASSIVEKLMNGKTKKEHIEEWCMKIIPINKGKIIVKYTNYYVSLPENIINLQELGYLPITEKGMREFYGDNTIRDVIEVTGSYPNMKTAYGPSRFDPILPKTRGSSKAISLAVNPQLDEREITWTVFADNAELKEGKIKLKDIPVVIKDETKK